MLLLDQVRKKEPVKEILEHRDKLWVIQGLEIQFFILKFVKVGEQGFGGRNDLSKAGLVHEADLREGEAYFKVNIPFLVQNLESSFHLSIIKIEQDMDLNFEIQSIITFLMIKYLATLLFIVP